MKQHEQMAMLAKIADARYRHEQAQLSALAQREASLRRSLALLAEQVRSAQAVPDQMAQMRPFGGDVAWLGWADRARRQLNMSLAQVLATKEREMSKVRRAHGKALVTEELAARSRAAYTRARRG